MSSGAAAPAPVPLKAVVQAAVSAAAAASAAASRRSTCPHWHPVHQCIALRTHGRLACACMHAACLEC
jgi:hypothetical protein